MRTYPPNSPRAAARLVALAMLVDGHYSRSELGVLEKAGAAAQLGLAPAELDGVIRHLAEDLMSTTYGQWGAEGAIDSGLLHSLMEEITDPELRSMTLDLCVRVVRADFHVADGEENLIGALARHWRLEMPALCPHP